MKQSSPVSKKAFISHATADASIVKAFVNLLEGGVGITPKDIFCTSIKGQGIKPGTDFKESIHQNLGAATTVVALISENFYNSPFCMCELGGVWLQAKDFLPILVPPVTFGDMKAVLSGLQALRLDSAHDLDELRDELAQRLGVSPLPTPRWNERRDAFLNELKSLITLLPPSPTVPRAQFDKVQQTLEEYKMALVDAHAKCKDLDSLNTKLRKAKDAEEVTQIISENLPEIEIFEGLTDSLSSSLKGMSKVSQEAAFLFNLREDLIFGTSSEFTWDDARSPIQYKELVVNPEERGVRINEDSPKMKPFVRALTKLERWLSADASNEFQEWYSSKYDGRDPDLSDRAFWDEHLW